MRTNQELNIVDGLIKPSIDDIAYFNDLEVCICVPCASYLTNTRFMKSIANVIAYSWVCGLKIYLTGITERMLEGS